ncbi:hypothetical protein [Streptomyces sp. NPDC059918]|uniref:hypothetical protein n=1 Tax=unclassified Streptomyces TaxID=2593676 RepID=UPI003660D403
MKSAEEHPSPDKTLQHVSRLVAAEHQAAETRSSYDTRRRIRHLEAWLVGVLALIATITSVIAYRKLSELIARVSQLGFQISDTAQIITAASTLTTAIAAGIAAILKAYALLIGARADVIRAKAGLPPANEPSAQSSEEEPRA